ncbi:MAG: ISAs1 family transposase [Anaerolineales bacterium]|nr:MAG: ISAs1 family transposase [Anaerolineales bacterium]
MLEETGIQTRKGIIADYFAEIEDPRIERSKEHKLADILQIAICGVICGADGWTGIEAYGKAKQSWLETFLELPHGIPSHDTFGRVFARIDPGAFESCFLKWIQAAQEITAGQVIAIDGKCLRRSYDTWRDKGAIHMVSAWASENGVVLGQRPVDSKSNEITAIPALIEVLELTGCIVTIDAMGCQKAIAGQIVDQGGDYVLALKDNQAHLHEDVISLFQWADNIAFAELESDTVHDIGSGHGRVEIRECWTISDPDALAMLADRDRWPGLRSVIRVQATRIIDANCTCETRYYISSLSGETSHLARTALHAVRRHWSIENELHWVLDIAFREDDSRIRVGHSAENMAVLRHIALNLLKQESSKRLGVKNKRLVAAWDNDYLLKVLEI